MHRIDFAIKERNSFAIVARLLDERRALIAPIDGAIGRFALIAPDGTVSGTAPKPRIWFDSQWIRGSFGRPCRPRICQRRAFTAMRCGSTWTRWCRRSQSGRARKACSSDARQPRYDRGAEQRHHCGLFAFERGGQFPRSSFWPSLTGVFGVRTQTDGPLIIRRDSVANPDLVKIAVPPP